MLNMIATCKTLSETLTRDAMFEMLTKAKLPTFATPESTFRNIKKIIMDKLVTSFSLLENIRGRGRPSVEESVKIYINYQLKTGPKYEIALIVYCGAKRTTEWLHHITVANAFEQLSILTSPSPTHTRPRIFSEFINGDNKFYSEPLMPIPLGMDLDGVHKIPIWTVIRDYLYSIYESSKQANTPIVIGFDLTNDIPDELKSKPILDTNDAIEGTWHKYDDRYKRSKFHGTLQHDCEVCMTPLYVRHRPDDADEHDIYYRTFLACYDTKYERLTELDIHISPYKAKLENTSYTLHPRFVKYNTKGAALKTL